VLAIEQLKTTGKEKYNINLTNLWILASLADYVSGRHFFKYQHWPYYVFINKNLL
jgi:hypothetical protein